MRIIFFLFVITAFFVRTSSVTYAQDATAIWKGCQSSGADERLANCTLVINAGGWGSQTRLADALDARCWANNAKANFTLAEADCRRSIALRPQYPYSYNNLGSSYLSQRKYAAAITALNRAVALKPNFIWPYINRARANVGLGEISKAISDYQRALAIDPNNSEIPHLLAEISTATPSVDDDSTHFPPSDFPTKVTPPDLKLSDRPSFDCAQVTARGSNIVAQTLCSGRDGAIADWSLNSTIWATANLGNDAQRRAFEQDQESWRARLDQNCPAMGFNIGFSYQQQQCILKEFHQRTSFLQSKLTGDALVEARLSPEQHAQIQQSLTRKGFLIGSADGEFGNVTRQAIRAFQQASGNPSTGFLTTRQISDLTGESPPYTQSRPLEAESKKLSQTEINLLKARLTGLWRAPPSNKPEEIVVDLRLHIGRDHRLLTPPEVVSRGTSPQYQAAVDAALSAAVRAQPYDMLSDDTFNTWSDMIVTFDPRTSSTIDEQVSTKANTPPKPYSAEQHKTDSSNSAPQKTTSPVDTTVQPTETPIWSKTAFPRFLHSTADIAVWIGMCLPAIAAFLMPLIIAFIRRLRPAD